MLSSLESVETPDIMNSEYVLNVVKENFPMLTTNVIAEKVVNLIDRFINDDGELLNTRYIEVVTEKVNLRKKCRKLNNYKSENGKEFAFYVHRPKNDIYILYKGKSHILYKLK